MSSSAEASSVTQNDGANVCPVSATPKTVYMIRHAESEENRRVSSLKSAAKAIFTRFSWPRSQDVSAAFELLRVSDQIDSNVSEFGKEQIAHMAQRLTAANFVAASQIELVAHSPLIRARETCRGMLGCMANPDAVTVESVKAVHELDFLKEKTPAEWLPTHSAGFYKRLATLEDWIAQQPETVIALVGHSQFFKALLKLDYKFGNCDVVQVEFQPSATGATSKWSNLKDVHICQLQPKVAIADSIQPTTPDEPKA